MTPINKREVMLLLTPEEAGMLHEALDKINLQGADNKIRVGTIMQKIEVGMAKLPAVQQANGVAEPAKKPTPRKRTRTRKPKKAA